MDVTEKISEATRNRHKTAWANLRGTSNLLDMKRAHFLHAILTTNLNGDVPSLELYIVRVLEEYAGKRTKSLARLALAFGQDESENHWRMLGGQGMILLSRADGRRRGRVIKMVEGTLNETKRDSISIATLRNILKTVLGEDYRKVLIEPQDHPLMTFRRQAILFQRQILALLNIPGVERAISKEVRVLLDLNHTKRDAS